MTGTSGAERLPCERAGESRSDEELLNAGRELMKNEAAEILRTADAIGPELVQAARIIYGCAGRVVVVGLGKSGHVGRKVSATLASLGTPSFFLHAAEALHGDLGMVRREDVGLFLSNSGTTAEVVDLIMAGRKLDFTFQFGEKLSSLPYIFRQMVVANDTAVASKYKKIQKSLNKQIQKVLETYFG